MYHFLTDYGVEKLVVDAREKALRTWATRFNFFHFHVVFWEFLPNRLVPPPRNSRSATESRYGNSNVFTIPIFPAHAKVLQIPVQYAYHPKDVPFMSSCTTYATRASKAAHSGFETQKRRHQKSTTGVSVALQ